MHIQKNSAIEKRMIITDNKLNKVFEEKKNKVNACSHWIETILIHECQLECQHVSTGLRNRYTLVG